MAAPGSEEAAKEQMLARQRAEIARRQRILAQIKDLETEISECEGLIASFDGLKGEVQSAAAGLKIAPAASYIDCDFFAGGTASATEQGLSGAQASMALKAVDLDSVEAAIGTQIGRLNTYIIELQERISSLRGSL